MLVSQVLTINATNMLERDKPLRTPLKYMGMYPWGSSWRVSVVINRVESHFADPNLRFKKFFEKERAAENRGVDFEIGDKDTSEHLY